MYGVENLHMKLLVTNDRGHPVLISPSNFLPSMETYCYFKLIIAVLYVTVSGSCCCSRASAW